MRTRADGRGIATVSAQTRAIVSGESSLEDWSDEELLRGMRRSRRGRWEGKPPKLVPAELHREYTRRQFQRAHAVLAESLADGAKLLGEIIRDRGASRADRLKATELLFDRVLGRPAQSLAVNLAAEEPAWRAMFASAIVATDEQAKAGGLPLPKVIDVAGKTSPPLRTEPGASG